MPCCSDKSKSIAQLVQLWVRVEATSCVCVLAAAVYNVTTCQNSELRRVSCLLILLTRFFEREKKGFQVVRIYTADEATNV